MNSPLDKYLIALARLRCFKNNQAQEKVIMRIQDEELPLLAEVIRILWQHVWAISDVEEGEICDYEDACTEIINESIKTMETIEKLIIDKTEISKLKK